MKIVFTICSNNYLAQAKTLGDSLLVHNPDYYFIIFLVDKLAAEIDYAFFTPYEIIPIDQVEIGGFNDMVAKYNITELNTAVKPFIFDFLFKRKESTEAIIYLDPDIQVFDRFDDLNNLFLEFNIIITPHWFTPIYDNFKVDEPDALNAGLYNLGFLGVKRGEESNKFLEWWKIKLRDLCYIDFRKGLFVDQLWINFVPIYYDKVHLLRHLGYNIAYWNLHERVIEKSNGKYNINNHYPLVFFHFSGYLFKTPAVVSKYQTRYSFDQRKDILPLFKEYHEKVMNNNYDKYFSIPCFYVQLGDKLKAKNWPVSILGIRRLANMYKHTRKKILFR